MSVDFNPESKIIAIVDDDPNICAFFNALLTKEGFKVAVFKNGDDLLNKLSLKSYSLDLVILDLMMPGSGGYDVLKKLQETEYSEVGIFVVTARQLDKDTINMIRFESNVLPKEFASKVHEILGTDPSVRNKNKKLPDHLKG